jgi:L-amino acid N-acyltransferase YncA
MENSMKFITCTYEEHACAILEILNEAIINSTAIYDYDARTIESMVNWFQHKEIGNFPVVGVVNNERKLIGFATYGTFRAWQAYKYSVEHSVYIHKDHRGKGHGRSLLKKLIAAAKQQEYHTMIGGIDITNISSVILHEKLGFTHVGTVREAAFKFNRWLDLGMYQLLLKTPNNPVNS